MMNIGNLDEETLMISIFLALEGVHAYSAFLPSVFTIKTFVHTEEGRDMIREGEVMASLFLAALAGVTVWITKSPLPLILGLVAGGGMLAVYEFALARAPVARKDHTVYSDCGCEDEEEDE
jgi:hypothetical protein